MLLLDRTKRIDSLTEDLERLNSKLRDQQELDNKLKSTEDNLKKAESILKSSVDKEIAMRATVAEAKFDVLSTFMHALLKNTTYREHVVGTIPVAVEGYPGSPANNGYGGTAPSGGLVVPSTMHTTTTKEVD